MFSSDDHQFQQQADKTRARLDESPKTLCGTHGGKGTYTVLDCTTAARSQGSLPEHEGKGMCTLPGCTTNAKARGLCCKHGGGTRTVCGHLGCSTKAHARGLCGKHGGDARSRCQHPACTTRAQTRGLCFGHGGRTYTQPYQAPDCAAPVLAHGLCSKHGGRLLCPEPGCFESESQEAGARSTTLHMTLHSTRTETSVCLREENLNLLCIVLS